MPTYHREKRFLIEASKKSEFERTQKQIEEAKTEKFKEYSHMNIMQRAVDSV